VRSMPIYEFQCTECGIKFELLSLRIGETVDPVCPTCNGAGTRLLSAPAIVYEVFNERATHKLPDWKQRQAKAHAHDAVVRRSLREPLPHDMGQQIHIYDTDFGKTERKRLESKAQLDNI
jgi:putative FmdB family regulatory protein